MYSTHTWSLDAHPIALSVREKIGTMFGSNGYPWLPDEGSALMHVGGHHTQG